MKKLYTSAEYAQKIAEAQKLGKKLYRVQKEVEYTVNVPDFTITGYK